MGDVIFAGVSNHALQLKLHTVDHRGNCETRGRAQTLCFRSLHQPIPRFKLELDQWFTPHTQPVSLPTPPLIFYHIIKLQENIRKIPVWLLSYIELFLSSHWVLSQIHVDHQICMYISCRCHINDLVILVNFKLSCVSMVNLDSLYEKTYFNISIAFIYCVLSLGYGKIKYV